MSRADIPSDSRVAQARAVSSRSKSGCLGDTHGENWKAKRLWLLEVETALVQRLWTVRGHRSLEIIPLPNFWSSLIMRQRLPFCAEVVSEAVTGRRDWKDRALMRHDTSIWCKLFFQTTTGQCINEGPPEK